MNNVLAASRGFAAAFAVVFWLALIPQAQAQPVLYGGGAGNNPAGGEVGIVNQANADFTFLGDPTADGPLTGISINSASEMFGTNNVGGMSGGNSVLIRINPANGQLLGAVGPILDSADNQPLKVTDIAFQPGTDTLFAVTGPPDGAKEGNLYTINTTTAVATLVGNTGLERGGLAFAPNGTLYLATVGDDVSAVIAQINPATAAVIGVPPVLSDDGIDGLAVRPTDSVIFGTAADSNDLYTIDPSDGSMNLLGSDGSNDGLASLAFSPRPLSAATAPAPALSWMGIMGLSVALLACGSILLRRRSHGQNEGHEVATRGA